MRVLVVTPSYPVPDNALAGVFVHRQIVNLARQGVACRVLVYRPAPPPFPRWLRSRSWVRYFWRRIGWPGEVDGVPVEEVFYRRTWQRDEDVVPAIGEALAAHLDAHAECRDADVVYAHWLWTGGAAALRLRERFGLPVVAIARGSEMHDWHAVHPHCRPRVEQVLREADRVLTNCEDLRERAEALVPGSSRSIEVVYNGCDAAVFRAAADREAARRAVGVAPDSKVLLFCGDVTARKGMLELADAWSRFAPDHSEWHLVVVGKLVEREPVSRLEAAGRVRFAGQVPPERVLTFMQAADAYVQPSRLEGLANATMEAMAVGLPVITTDTCGQRELIQDGENGWLIPPGDVEALVRALSGMASDPGAARERGKAARRTIETRFDPKREAARLAGVLRTAAAGAATATSPR